MLRRSCAVFLALAIVISVCIPAFAAPSEVNIWEYANIQVDGLTKEVTISFPQEWLEVGIYNNVWQLVTTRQGNVSGFDLSDLDFPFEYLHVVFAPLGSVHNPASQEPYNGRYPDFSDLPNGSVLHYSVSVQLQNASGESIRVAASEFNRSDLVAIDSITYLRNPFYESVPINSDVANGIYSSSYDFVLTDNSQPFVFQHHFFLSSSNASSRWIFRLEDLTISTSLDALQDLVDATGETNKLLDEVNKKLDQIIDGEVPTPDDPSGGQGQQLEDQTDDILSSIQGNIDYLHNLILQWSDIIEDLAVSFQAWGQIFFFFINIPWVSTLLITSICFGCCATLFGVVAGLFKKE